MIITAVPRAQHDTFRRKIERQILEIESRIVPGLASATAALLREQVQALESKLAPTDDKRNPAYYRPRRKKVEPTPVLLWSQEDWIAAKWGAKKRCAGVCEICASAPAEVPRIWRMDANKPLTRDHVEVVCVVCADQHPRESFP